MRSEIFKLNYLHRTHRATLMATNAHECTRIKHLSSFVFIRVHSWLNVHFRPPAPLASAVPP